MPTHSRPILFPLSWVWVRDAQRKLVATLTVGRKSYIHTCEHTISRQGQNGETSTGFATTGRDPL